MVGLVGVLVVLRPSGEGAWSLAGLAVLVAAVLGAYFLVFGFLVADEALIKAWVPGSGWMVVSCPAAGVRAATGNGRDELVGWAAQP